MAERQFRLPGSTYEELTNIIVAYGTRDEATRTGDVGKLDSVHQSSVSRTNAFLTEIGVLQGESKKLITRRGRSLAVALARRDRDEVRANWRAVVSSTEFLQNVVSAVKLREGMLRPTVLAYIAHAAGQPRNKPVMAGAGAIVEILKTAGLLREEAGELVAVFEDLPFDLEEPEIAEEPPEEPADKPPDEPAGEEPPRISVVAETNGAAGDILGDAPGTPPVQIHLHVRLSPDEIEDLAPRLKALLRELGTP